ncbi:MAG TPA: aromatic ring-hydroxylating dioxygenase subunit alpha [Stellaceae bacterium]|nr:aromatic ring-hydroxylating dioxygenase subunit alpha [Stellaceae bacterium]
MFIRNSWYVAAWSSEVGSTRPLGRTVLEEPIVLFRSGSGNVAALGGRCAHRRMPLSHAKVDGDTLICCYHGLTYDATGRCVRVPGQDSPPRGIGVRRYPAAERYGAVWVWMGDPDLADETMIFSCNRLDAAGTNGHKFYFHVKANYLYLNDNLSDLLHQAYLHNPSFGGNTYPLGETVPAISERGRGIEVRWDWDDVPVPGLFGELGQIAGRADGWNHSTYEAPSFYINDVGFAETGTGKKESGRPQGAGKLSFAVHQLITPETARTTHFFKIVHCDWPPELVPELVRVINPVNQEDIWACEEQQRMEELDPSAPMSTIPTDNAVVAMRRLLRRVHEEESRAGRARTRRVSAAEPGPAQ